MRITQHKVVLLPFEVEVPKECPECEMDLVENMGMLRLVTLVPTDWGCYENTKGTQLNSTPTYRTHPDRRINVGFVCGNCEADLVPVVIEKRTPPCILHKCTNLGRYTSGYCGIHDIIYNEGKGEKRGESVEKEKAPPSTG